ncbi:MAG: TonB-dependent receptor [Alphaproteobacteria bacterium]|nr:TonB-dependent receptor [Alphaproteobacteria bacterium]MBU1513948.1 TonB-dependent receptor [Alphaproteobacteria bacterium]MBU2092620.1 TonB-dependent receptor [Alphaproteobacteria bacterium]MBU2309495.1 TonB-dependent receptor [Alphaproteobacteria bacterium]MBU2364185.1 TonB-dependent receptor [Alphaproteobacteria bacterium]
MNFRPSLLASSALLAVVLGAPATAYAQAANVIEELVVTAEKREQSLQDVPVAISAFTSKQRDLVGISTVQDLTNFTPGFTYQSANDRASMRGIGRLTNVHSVDGAVSIYIDGLFTTSTVLAGGPPLDVERVEILRGPQGTLYGRNAIGGALNVLSVRPTEEFYAEVRAIAENYGFTNFQAAVSGPIADNLQFRVSGYKLDQRKGYYTNVAGGPSEGSKRDEYQVQAQLQAQLGENADLWVSYKTLVWHNRGGPGARAGYLNGPYETGLTDPNFSIVYNPAHGYTPATGLDGIVPGSLRQFGGTGVTTNPALADSRDFQANNPQRVRLRDVNSLTANFVYHLPTVDIRYVGGIQEYKYDLYGDTDGTNVQSYQLPIAPGGVCANIGALFAAGRSTVNCTPLTVNADNTYHYFEYPRWFSHEVNISSTHDGPLQWIAGAYYYHEKYTGTGSTADFFVRGPNSLQTPVLGAAANPSGTWSTGNYGLTTESKAVFGQVDWQATETIKFTAGLRYTKDKKFGTEYRRIVCNSDACYPGLYTALGLGALGPGTAANYGSLLGNLGALPAVGQALGLGNALAGLGGLGNGAFDLTDTLAPKSTTGAIEGVKTPSVCTGAGAAQVCRQYVIGPNGIASRELSDGSDATTGTVGLQWEPDDDTMAYGRYSRGYKAFGFSAGGFLAVPKADAEFVNSYELGLKKNFSNLQVNLAVFYLDYRNLQAPVTIKVGPTNVGQFINIAKSRSSGVEFSTIWQPIRPVRLTLDYGFNPTKIRKSVPLVDVNDNINTAAISIVGNRLPQAPKHKVAVNGSYTFEMEPGALTLGATYLYRSESYANVFTREYNKAPSWDQVDLRAYWAPTGGKYTVIAYVKNVFDTEGYDAALAASNRNNNPLVASDRFATGAQNLELTPPRLYGIELQYRF